MESPRQMTPQYVLCRHEACVLIAMEQHGNEKRAKLASREIHETWPGQEFGELRCGAVEKAIRNPLEDGATRLSHDFITRPIDALARRCAGVRNMRP